MKLLALASRREWRSAARHHDLSAEAKRRIRQCSKSQVAVVARLTTALNVVPQDQQLALRQPL